MSTPQIAFIGAGNMAAALIAGLLADGTPAQNILASDPDSARLDAMVSHSIRTTQDNQQAVEQADIVVLAVKPQMLKSIAEQLSQTVQSRRPLILSIAAGIRAETLSNWLGGELPVVRSMPNTPAMLQAGATGLYANPSVSEPQKQLAESVMRAVGLTRWVDNEDLMDVVTAVSGSGPAYFFLVMEAMQEAAEQLGLDPETARLLTLQTALGAARMAIESPEPPATLRARVTSPGGTTEQAINSLERDKLRDCFARALHAARDRSVELSQLLAEK